MAAVRYIDVAEPEQMQLHISQLISQGFVVANQNNRSITLVKRKRFSIAWLIIGFFLFMFPLFIYLIVYALQKDQIVEIRLIDRQVAQPFRASEHLQPAGADAPPPQPWPVLQLSPDGSQWLDGSAWQHASQSVPSQAVRHQDGRRWWDGARWRQLPGAVPQSARGEISA
jgi:hypothetical protein